MNESQKPLTPRGRLIFGLCFVAMGVAPMLATFNVGPLGTADINGPPWLGFVAGGVFVVGGLAVIVGPGRPVLNGLLALVVLSGLAAVGNWIAFGVGERVCSASILFWADREMSGLGCRIPFGLGAVITNAIALLALIATLQHMLGGPTKLAGLRRLAENLVFLTLTPILLPVVLLLFGRVALEAITTRVRTGKWPRNEAFIARMEAKKKAGAESANPRA